MATKGYFYMNQSGLAFPLPGSRLAGVYVNVAEGGSFMLRDSAQLDPGLRAADPIVMGWTTPEKVGLLSCPCDLKNGLWVEITPPLQLTVLSE